MYGNAAKQAPDAFSNASSALSIFITHKNEIDPILELFQRLARSISIERRTMSPGEMLSDLGQLPGRTGGVANAAFHEGEHAP